MPHTITHFDTAEHHIHIEFFVSDNQGQRFDLNGVLDTGAPRTEFSDKFLVLAGFIKERELLLNRDYRPKNTASLSFRKSKYAVSP